MWLNKVEPLSIAQNSFLWQISDRNLSTTFQYTYVHQMTSNRKYSDTEKFVVITLKFELCGSTIQ